MIAIIERRSLKHGCLTMIREQWYVSNAQDAVRQADRINGTLVSIKEKSGGY